MGFCVFRAKGITQILLRKNATIPRIMRKAWLINMSKCSCNSGTCAVDTNSADDCCGHEHQHDHESHEHDHGHDHPQESCGCSTGHTHADDGCGCSGGHSHEDDGCGCGGGCGHGDTSHIKQDIIAIVAAAVIAGGSYIAPEGIWRSALMLVAILVVGAPIFLQGIKNIFRLKLEEMALMTIAVTAAIVIGEMPEALLVTLLFRIGHLFEDLAVAKSQREIEAVIGILPEEANLLLDDGNTKTIASKELKIGSRILIKSGERVPADSIIISGSSSVDTSSLTGESIPREVATGDALLSGMVNIGGVLTAETTSSFDDSTASKIIEMVRESSAKKGNTERLLTKFARVYTPLVIVAAVLVAVLPPLLGFGSWTQWISRSLVFLVASCPCALVIAIPLSFFAGIGASSKRGILVKGSKYMEVLAKAEAVVFDKTGTLTTGRLSVSGIHATNGYKEDEVLRLAALGEMHSNHPIAAAIVKAAGDVDSASIDSSEEITSYGMKAVVNGDEILAGSSRLMERFGIDISDLPQANVYVAKNGTAVGAVTVYDRPREDAAGMLAELKAAGVTRTAMLTGDSSSAANQTAMEIKLGEVHADLLPADKVEIFEKISSEAKGTVLYVGDGINDSPVLARADAGIAMGLASDAAIEAADVVLMSDKLSSLPQAIRIARRTGRLARFNIAFALIIKFAVLIMAFFGIADMWLAVFADVGVTVIAVLNATRALGFK